MNKTELVIAVIIIILIIVFNKQVCYMMDAAKASATSAFSGPKMSASRGLPDDDDLEHMTNNRIVRLPPGESSKTLVELGYTGGVPWSEVLAATEVDPSIHASHMDFVKDVRRYSSGANFTSVTDDNTNIDFVNFRGLVRPQSIPNMIGDSARQTPDIDETVLLRNKMLRFN